MLTRSAYNCPKLNIYLDDKLMGDVNRLVISPVVGLTTTVKVNLIAGSHTVKWELPPSVRLWIQHCRCEFYPYRRR